MSLRNSATAYGSVTKFLHWMIFLLVVVMLVVGYFQGDISDKALKGIVVNIHKLTGLTILVLMMARLIWALSNPKPRLPADPVWWERFAERSVHFSLYALLIAMPLSGWIMSSAGGKPPHFFSLVINFPVQQSKPLKELFWQFHVWLAIAIIVFVSIHILAALYHYFIRKDNVLQRMLPGRKD